MPQSQTRIISARLFRGSLTPSEPEPTPRVAPHLTTPRCTYALEGKAGYHWSNRVVGNLLRLAFRTERIRSLCEDAEHAFDEFGEEVADTLRERLAQIHAADFVTELFVGSPVELSGRGMGRYALDLADGMRLYFRCNHPIPPRLPTGRVDWSQVYYVKIVAMGNHDD